MSVRGLLVAAAGIAAGLLMACGDDSQPDTSAAPATVATSSASPASTGCTPLSPQSPDTHTLIVKASYGEPKRLIVQLADTGAERGFGLMNRPCLPENSGMLFAWQADTNTGFYMRDTLIPLSIAFVLADGEIVHIEDMAPNTEDNHFSPVPYRYAIEVAQGWFDDNGVAVGDSVEIPEVISAKARD